MVNSGCIMPKKADVIYSPDVDNTMYQIQLANRSQDGLIQVFSPQDIK